MVVKIFSTLLLILMISISKGVTVDGNVSVSQAIAQPAKTQDVDHRQHPEIEVWLHSLTLELEAQLTESFWTWWQADQAQSQDRPGSTVSLDQLAAFKEARLLVTWVQGQLGQLQAQQIATLREWMQGATAETLTEQQVQTLRAWRDRDADAKTTDDTAAIIDALTRLEQELEPTLPSNQPPPPPQPDAQPHGSKASQAAIARLEQQHHQSLQQWMQAGAQHLSVLDSPLGSPAAATMPPECVTHLQEDMATLARHGVTKEAWLHHVFDCDMCCAPLLDTIMEAHVRHVTQLPHMVALFDFDTYRIRPHDQRQLDALMQHFDKARDQILLIGRASQIGDRSYNIRLSGQRAGEIQDYLMANFGLQDSQLRYLYFGYDPPQLTLDNAKRYGISQQELAAIDVSFNHDPTHKINQSVVVVIYKASAE